MSVIDAYLDELFNHLAGTGEAGRQMLAEAEEHLRMAVAEEVAAGRSATDAERVAVRRFGAPADIGRRVRRAARYRWMPATLSGAWLFAGLAVLGVGLTYLLAALDVEVLRRMHPEPGPQCPSGAAFGCSDTTEALNFDIAFGAALVAVAVLVVVARALTIRWTALVAAGPRFPFRAAAAFALAGLALFVTLRVAGYDTLIPGPPGPGFFRSIIATAVAFTAAIALTARGLWPSSGARSAPTQVAAVPTS